MSDDIATEYIIAELTGSDELRNTIKIRSDAGGPSKVHGKATRIILEGHDISHMVSSMRMEHPTDSVSRLTIEFIGLRPI